MLEHKKGTPLRFPIGTRVEVREQPESYTGRYLGMYSIGTVKVENNGYRLWCTHMNLDKMIGVRDLFVHIQCSWMVM